MVGQLRVLTPAAVILEATAGRSIPAPVAVVNPRRVRNFAKSTGKLAKTDALVLAHCVEAVRAPMRPLRVPDTQDSTR